MYNYYYNSSESYKMLQKLPAFVTKNVDSTFYKLINPYGVYAESFYQECIDCFKNINPMILDYGLPPSVFVAFNIKPDYVPYTSEASLVLAADLKEFANGYPTGLDVAALSSESFTNQSGDDIADVHYVSPLHYKDTEGVIQKLDSGYYMVHEGIYVSENLISIYDDKFNFIQYVTLPYLSQRGSDSINDEWIEGITGYCDGTNLDPDLNSTACGNAGGTYKIRRYYLNNPFLIKDSLRVINPLLSDVNGSALVINPSSYTIGSDVPNDDYKQNYYIEFNENITDSGGNTYSIFDIQLIVEYNYFPSMTLGGIAFLNSNHSVASTSIANSYPLCFSYISNNVHELNSGASFAGGYDPTTSFGFTDTLLQSNLVVRSDESSLAGNILTSKLRLHGHEARVGTSVTVGGIYTLQQDEAFTFGAGVSELSSANSFQGSPTTRSIRNIGIKIDSTTAPSTDYYGNEIKISDSDFRVTVVPFTAYTTYHVKRVANLTYVSSADAQGNETLTDITTVITVTSEIDVDYEVSDTVETYHTKYDETLKVVTPGSSESFYLSYRNNSVISAKDETDAAVSVASEVDLDYKIKLDTSGLSAGDLVYVSYNAYTQHYNKDGKDWFESMSNTTIDISAVFPLCTYISRKIDVVKRTTGCMSLTWFNRGIHLEEEYFSKALVSLNKTDNILHLYDSSNSLLDSKLLIPAGAKSTVDTSDTTTNTMYLTSVENKQALCVRYFENTIIVMYCDDSDQAGTLILNSGQTYTFRAYDIDTLTELWSHTVDLGAAFLINAFTIDKEHNIKMISKGGKCFTLNFRYDYYIGLNNIDGLNFKDFYFRYKYSDLVFKDASDNTQMSNQNEDLWTTDAILDVTSQNVLDFPADSDDTLLDVLVSSVTGSSAGLLNTDFWTNTNTQLTLLPNARAAANTAQTDAVETSPVDASVDWDIQLAPDAGYTLTDSTIISATGASAGAFDVKSYDASTGIVTIEGGDVGNEEEVTIAWDAPKLLSNGETLDVIWKHTGNDFTYEERITNYSVDEMGRLIGSDRWFSESGVDYLSRLKNITSAAGNVSTEAAIAGISSTFNAVPYNLNNQNQFSLQYPIKSGEAENTIVTLNGRYDYWRSTLTDTSVPPDGVLDGEVLSYAGGDYTVEDSSVTFGKPGILTINNTGSTSGEEIEVEIIYKTTLLDSNNENIMATDYFVYKNYTQPQTFASIITIDDLTDSSFIDANHILRNGVESTGIYSKELIKYLKKGSGNFKFKWNEFEWDHYEWADGANIVNGLPTYFDGITCVGYAGIDPTEQKFDNGVTGNALKYLGKNENGNPEIYLGKFFYLDYEYNLYDSPHELLLDPGNYPVAGTWHDDSWTPLVYFTDEDGDDTVETANYLEPGSSAPVVVNDEVSVIAMNISPGDTGLNSMEPQYEIFPGAANGVAQSITTSLSNFAVQTDGMTYGYEVYSYIPIADPNEEDHVTLLIEDTDYTINLSTMELTNTTGGTVNLMLVYNSSTYLNSFYMTANKPEGSNIRLNRISKYHFANTSNLNEKSVYTDNTKQYGHEDLTALENPYADSDIDLIKSNSSAPILANNEFYFRDASATGNRPWITQAWDSKTVDIRLDQMGSTGVYTCLFDKSHERKTKILAGEGPQLNHKDFNIGNSILALGRTNLPVNSIEIFCSRKIVNPIDCIYLFIKLTDEEHGRVANKPVVVSTSTANVILTLDTVSTQEDGISIVKVNLLISNSTAGDIITLDVAPVSDDETWSGSVDLKLNQDVASGN